MNENKKYILLLASIILVGFILRIVVAQGEWVDVDEGNFLYDAKLLSEGAKPFVDYYTRDIVYSYVLSGALNLFGDTLFAGRLLSILASLVSIFFIYKIGSLLYNRKVGLISALLYAILPFVIFWDTLSRADPVQRTFVVIAMFCFAKAYKENRYWYYFLNGLFLGVAFFIKRSVAIFVITELVLLIYLYRENIISFLKKISLVYLGGILFFIVMLVLITKFYGFSAFTSLIGLEHMYVSSFSWIQALGSRAFVPYWFLREGIYMFIFVLVFLGLLIKRKRLLLVLVSLLIFLISLLIFRIAIIKFADRLKYYPILPSYLVFIFLIITIGLFILSFYILKSNIKLKLNFSNLFLLFWFGSIFIFYFFYVRWHVVYFVELSPVIVLMGGLTLYKLGTYKISVNKLFLGFLVISIIFSSIFYIGFHGMSNIWEPETVYEISDYVKENTKSDSEIFTPITIIPFLAERRLALNITHPLYYHYKGIGEKDIGGFPSVNSIIKHLDKVDYVIVDKYMDVTYYPLHPELKIYINDNYILNKEIGGIKVLTKRS